MRLPYGNGRGKRQRVVPECGARTSHDGRYFHEKRAPDLRRTGARSLPRRVWIRHVGGRHVDARSVGSEAAERRREGRGDRTGFARPAARKITVDHRPKRSGTAGALLT